jgi:adenine/guanine/hypoxanthine permease
LALDLKGALHAGLWVAILTFFFVALIDSTATLVGLAHLAGFISKENDDIPRINRVLMSDSIATVVGSLLGTSTIASYIESAAGIRAGGRTGLTSVVVGILFLGALFLSPLADSIPAYATAPALFFVAILMMQGIRHIAWQDFSEWLPSVITIVAIPLTFSVAKGVSIGFISYILVKVLLGKAKTVKLSVYILGIIFVSYLLV